jgi:rubrerythrin
MRHATAVNMRNAFGGECAAHMRYLIFSERAELEKFPNVARMFRALAFAERVHASSHYRLTRELLGEYCVSFTAPFIYSRTVDNLVKTYKAELDESEELYPPFAAVAHAQNEKHAAQNFEWMTQVEKCHSDMAKKVLDYMEHAAEEPKMGELYVCDVCGLAIEGEPPENCPVCMAKRFRFKHVE